MGEYTGFSIGIDHMSREHAVAFPGGISCSIQPANFVLQPRNIPTAFLGFDSHNRGVDLDDRNFDGQTGCIKGGTRGGLQLRHHPRRKTSYRNKETIGSYSRFLFVVIIGSSATISATALISTS